jgi:hypothetical protein
MYHEVLLKLEPHHVHKLASGKTIHLTHDKIGEGMSIIVKRPKSTRLHRAKRMARGSRLKLDPDELEMQGGSFLSVLKNIGSFIKDKVFTNPVYKQAIAPLIRQGLNAGVDALSTAVGSKAPFLAPLVGEAGRAGVSKLGEVSGAYGLGHMKRRRGASGAILSQNPGPFMEFGGPLNPNLPRRDYSSPDYTLPEREMGIPVPRRGRFEKGSAEAKAWSEQMKIARAMKRRGASGSFLPAGGY